MATEARHQIDARRIAMASLETIAAVGAATGLVAVLDEVAPVTGLGVVYLLAVLFVAIRRGRSRRSRRRCLSVLGAQLLLHRAAPPADDRRLRERRRAGRVPDRGGRRRPPGRGRATARARPRSAPRWPRRASARRRCWPRAASRCWPAPTSTPSWPDIGTSVGELDRRRPASASSLQLGPGPRRGRARRAACHREPPGWLYVTRRRRLGRGRPRAASPSRSPADRRRARARAGRGAGGRGRGGPPRRRRQDRAPPRDLPRPALAADRDHDGGRRPAQRPALPSRRPRRARAR